MPTDKSRWLPPPEWITDRPPAQADATAAGWVILRRGRIAIYEFVTEVEWRAGWCPILVPAE